MPQQLSLSEYIYYFLTCYALWYMSTKKTTIYFHIKYQAVRQWQDGIGPIKLILVGQYRLIN